ncbi:ABC transporter ATP-binding protein [Aureimonas jatrophae]|uniref:ATP-binding cassette, subfamily B n=1 Tax=Aureimonas jatrophae TaxID=1166073 RepID=A0A1H0CAS3_9HYPH|nr:ABC transporter ATP-binding protein [Aureimonas jatrophae]MBB3949148.1 ATP-binding cassette subfamily B protein [Aureimonas jatrophae]SDN54969.1 ATP-binding cassette, subfamily B [Aureimonas jatrophae]
MKKTLSLSAPEERGQAWRVLRRVIAENGRAHLRGYAVAVVCLVLVALSTAFLAWIMRDVIDQIFVAGNRAVLFSLPVAVFLSFLVRGFATYGQGVILARIGNDVVARYQRRLFEHLTSLSVGYFNRTRSAQLAARINQNVSGVRDTLNLTVTSIARDLLTLIFLVFAMIWQDWVLSLIALTAGPPIAIMIARLSRKLRKATRQSVDLNARVLGAMQETVQGIHVVKAFTMEAGLQDRTETLIRAAEERSNRIATITERSGPVTETVAGLAVAAVIAWSGYRAIVYGTSPGAMFAFITALLLAYDPARRLARLQVQLERALVNAQMIYEILDETPEQADRSGTVPLRVANGEVRFEDVRFGYHPGEPVLRGLSFTAPAGRTTALVGASGGGKTTVLALLERFYDPEAGRILIDGQDIAGVQQSSLRRQISYVPQHPTLFEGTIRDNIRFGRPEASDAEVEDAARRAQAEEFILAAPLGYDTPVGENGLTLSGGQRQRLSIARALLRDAPILVLDEATSALDSRSEALVQRALDEAMRERTVIVVAHRLSTVRHAEQILVVDRGRIAEHGSHDELMARPGGLYARLNAMRPDTVEDDEAQEARARVS